MLLLNKVAALRSHLTLIRLGKDPFRKPEIGLVPTMGALHAGHLSLIRRARQENAVVIVSIFVNPLQFGVDEDFQKYPRQLESDRQLCKQAGVDVIFAPPAEEMGMEHGELTAVVPVDTMTSVLCGKYRPGHFQGVATIVTKLFNSIEPTAAYFGQKDAQQVAIVRRLVADLNIPVEIVVCPTLREPSGLAMSSRNQYLTLERQTQASVLYRGLQQAERAFRAGERFRSQLITIVEAQLATVPAIKPEYVELVNPDTLMPLDKVEEVGLLAIAARLDSTRLIDNILLRNRQPIVAIDGPAGAGKSTVARQVARELGLLYLDTGAMYRAVTWLVLQSGISIADEPAVAEITRSCFLQLATDENPQAPVRVWINDREVTQAIRSVEVTANVSALAAQSAVRRELVKQQQRWGEKGGIVVEGRDIGTYVFPDAELKIFLTASIQERAKRRQQDLKVSGEADMSLAQMEQNLSERDWKDSHRDVAPLQKAPDAIEIQTDDLSVDQVTASIVSLYLRRMKCEG